MRAGRMAAEARSFRPTLRRFDALQILNRPDQGGPRSPCVQRSGRLVAVRMPQRQPCVQSRRPSGGSGGTPQAGPLHSAAGRAALGARLEETDQGTPRPRLSHGPVRRRSPARTRFAPSNAGVSASRRGGARFAPASPCALRTKSPRPAARGSAAARGRRHCPSARAGRPVLAGADCTRLPERPANDTFC